MDRYLFDYRTYQPVNRCIYCGAEGEGVRLTREHIIPYSLGGRTVLPKASCDPCAEITLKFEGICSGTLFGPFRTFHNMPTRRKAARPKTLPVFILRDGKRHEVQIPTALHPGPPLALPEFGPPGLTVGQPPRPITLTEIALFAPQDHFERRKILGMGPMQIEGRINLNAFCRLLAKICHSHAVADYGLGSFEPMLLGIINGSDSNHAYLIGGSKEDVQFDPRFKPALHLNELGIFTRNKEYWLGHKIRLFAQMGTPTYFVIVGKPTPELTQRLLSRAGRG